MDIRYFDPAVTYYVDDVERSVRFYIDNFGFVEVFRTPETGAPEHVEIQLGQLTLGLAARASGMTLYGVRLGEGGGPPRAEVLLWTDDVDVAFADLVAAGVPVISPPHDFIDRVRAAWVMDPEGNPVEIVSRLEPGRHLFPA